MGRDNGPFPLWYVPARNHGSCIYLLGLDVCFDESNYHDSLQARLIEGIRHLMQCEALKCELGEKTRNIRF